MNQEGTQMKRTPQSNPVTNAEPLRLPIVGEYLDELQTVNQAKETMILLANQNPTFNC